jgi:hypothetical protein
MPTLIRLVIVLLVLVGLAYGAMFGLVAMVEPGEKEVTVRIPTRELVAAPDSVPVVRREIDTTRQAPVVAVEPTGDPAPPPGSGEPLPSPSAPADSDIVEVEPPGRE